MHATSRGVRVALWTATAVAAFGIGWITPPPQGSPAPDDVVASLRSALGEGDVIERQGRTASLLERLDPFDVPEVAALYERMIPLIDPWELAAFFAAWARFDAVGALDHALLWRRSETREQREIGLRAAIQVWAQRDPSAARLAAEQISADHPAVREALRRALVMGWAHSRQGQEGLADFIADLPPLHSRSQPSATRTTSWYSRARSSGPRPFRRRSGIPSAPLRGSWSIRGQITPKKVWTSWPSIGADGTARPP
jgi:hypothetical protein